MFEWFIEPRTNFFFFKKKKLIKNVLKFKLKKKNIKIFFFLKKKN